MFCLSDFDLSTLQSAFASRGFKTAHARIVLRQFYQAAGAASFDTLSIARSLQNFLRDQCSGRRAIESRRHISRDGTIKLLLNLDGGGAVETVLMPSFRPDVAAGCLSSQIGCAMGCDFCA